MGNPQSKNENQSTPRKHLIGPKIYSNAKRDARHQGLYSNLAKDFSSNYIDNNMQSENPFLGYNSLRNGFRSPSKEKHRNYSFSPFKQEIVYTERNLNSDKKTLLNRNYSPLSHRNNYTGREMSPYSQHQGFGNLNANPNFNSIQRNVENPTFYNSPIRFDSISPSRGTNFSNVLMAHTVSRNCHSPMNYRSQGNFPVLILMTNPNQNSTPSNLQTQISTPREQNQTQNKEKMNCGYCNNEPNKDFQEKKTINVPKLDFKRIDYGDIEKEKRENEKSLERLKNQLSRKKDWEYFILTMKFTGDLSKDKEVLEALLQIIPTSSVPDINEEAKHVKFFLKKSEIKGNPILEDLMNRYQQNFNFDKSRLEIIMDNLLMAKLRQMYKPKVIKENSDSKFESKTMKSDVRLNKFEHQKFEGNGIKKPIDITINSNDNSTIIPIKNQIQVHEKTINSNPVENSTKPFNFPLVEKSSLSKEPIFNRIIEQKSDSNKFSHKKSQSSIPNFQTNKPKVSFQDEKSQKIFVDNKEEVKDYIDNFYGNILSYKENDTQNSITVPNFASKASNHNNETLLLDSNFGSNPQNEKPKLMPNLLSRERDSLFSEDIRLSFNKTKTIEDIKKESMRRSQHLSLLDEESKNTINQISKKQSEFSQFQNPIQTNSNPLKEAQSFLIAENITKANPFGIPFAPPDYDSMSSDDDYMDVSSVVKGNKISSFSKKSNKNKSKKSKF